MIKKLKDQNVLVTGHTGFKGSWLVQWLNTMGVSVNGLSDEIPTKPSHFEVAECESILKKDYRADIRDTEVVVNLLDELRPNVVFHLASQPIVRRSIDDPVETFSTNVVGTANLLEAIRKLDEPTVVVCITSDKCYENVEWIWGYKETDRLGGKDPYSASKAGAELVISSYVRTHFLNPENGVRVGVGRAGNVIGGGDWAADRIVPDCARAWANHEPVQCRNPFATRPWQHVLEPLSGYVALAEDLLESDRLHGEAFNFGPPADHDYSVGELIDEMAAHWPGAARNQVSDENAKLEAGLLKLNCEKAKHWLKWESRLSWEETTRMTAEWYRDYYGGKNPAELTRANIELFESK